MLELLLRIKKVAAFGSLIKRSGISNFCDSPLKRGDKGVCKFAEPPPAPLSRGEIKSRCRRQPNL